MPPGTPPEWLSNICSLLDKAIYEGFHQWGYPKMVGLYWKIPLNWMIWGYPYSRKPPYGFHIPDCDPKPKTKSRNWSISMYKTNPPTLLLFPADDWHDLTDNLKEAPRKKKTETTVYFCCHRNSRSTSESLFWCHLYMVVEIYWNLI